MTSLLPMRASVGWASPFTWLNEWVDDGTAMDTCPSADAVSPSDVLS
jgi:hypothetical protein